MSDELAVVPPGQIIILGQPPGDALAAREQSLGPPEQSLGAPKPERKHYLTRFLPGDIVHCRDGTIAQIHEAKVFWRHPSGVTKQVNWNFRPELYQKADFDPEKIVGEKYTLVEIPGHRLHTQGWRRIGEFEKVLCGPLHDVLGGRSGVVEITQDEMKKEDKSRKRPIVRAHTTENWLSDAPPKNKATTVYRLG